MRSLDSMLECVPNVSEGRDATIIAALTAAGGRSLLDVHTDRDHNRSVFTLAGPGFRDATRIASGSPDIWHDIVKSNQHSVLAELALFEDRLRGVIRMVESGDFDGLKRVLEESRQTRARLV